MRRLGLMAVGVLLLVACSDDGPSEGSSDGSPPEETSGAGVALSAQGTASLEGAVDASGDFELHYPNTVGACEGLLDEASFLVPVPLRLDELALRWDASLRRFDGPGTYDLEALTPFSVTITADDAAVTFEPGPAAEVELSVEDDASGEMTFAGVLDPDGNELSGVLSWSCALR